MSIEEAQAIGVSVSSRTEPWPTAAKAAVHIERFGAALSRSPDLRRALLEIAAAFATLPPSAATMERLRRVAEDVAAARRDAEALAEQIEHHTYTITIRDFPPEFRAPKPARSTNESWRRQGKRPGRPGPKKLSRQRS